LIEQANPDWQDLAVDLGFAPIGGLDSRVRGNDEEGQAMSAHHDN